MASGQIRKIQETIKDLGVEAFLVMTKNNRQYLSGFTGSAGMLLIAKNSAMLFVDPRYFLRAKKETAIPVKPLEQYPSVLKRSGIKKVGVEDLISLREFNNLKNPTGFRWTITHDVIENFRAQKTAQEIAFIRKGSQIIDETFKYIRKYILKYIHPSEAEIAYKIERIGKNLGAEANAFDPIIAFGPNAAAPHHSSSNKKIGRDNFLLLDFGFKFKGYHSDFSRTLFVGRPSAHHEKVYNIVLNAQASGIKSAKIGIEAKEVHSQVYDSIQKAGYGKFFTHNSGHGVGLQIHELPSLSPDSDQVLRRNNVATMEPGIYLPGKFGVRIEDMIVVSEKTEVLSRIPKDFKSMVINI
ncbi:MAG: aminopeptidase P family protein [Candidatus Doudnabacteria bacterium]|nr:aminopeptidase P family protein [Candidatus Doudnabacteria bacterium]